MSKITEILLQKIRSNHDLIEGFFAEKFSKTPPVFYNSVDLRHSGFKIAPVDTNCFPAGFNNLSPFSKDAANGIAQEYLAKNFPLAKKILIVPEDHTRNLRYLQNIVALQEILSGNNCEVLVGSLNPNLSEKTTLDLENGKFLILQPLKKKEDEILTQDGFKPDLVLLNNDLTNGIPSILHNLKTPIVPSPKIGWHNRAKSRHFTIYNQLSEELAKLVDLDPWLISSLHNSCQNIDFKSREGLESLASQVDELLRNLSRKYQKCGIAEQPYCFIKADNGTYGIAVWPVFSAEEVLQINKKERNKMNMLKGAVQNTKVMIQEGIKTIDKIGGKVAEPMIYMINGRVVGNLFRANVNRTEKTSLNADGANFFDLDDLSENEVQIGGPKNSLIEIYSLISRLAALAAAMENSQNFNL